MFNDWAIWTWERITDCVRKNCYITPGGGQPEVKPCPAATPGAQGWPVPLKLAAPGHVVPRGPLHHVAPWLYRTNHGYWLPVNRRLTANTSYSSNCNRQFKMQQ